ncbi:thiol-disulfide oxidoreductase DCC family protein [Mesobacillus subterraneus]|uniref:Thiol-disulfide oxidoreductase DCC family protein n=1 Tax=Mesobacillus subterraneus TaxID=285983 RepID=A0A3R9ECF0_9BACI|nr:thiol-disulfide oxidoreductase DCC family protein [Mesobacillus subterraneus]RSD28728.1 thiol-disulfide oxidoreductase DCC family protein [Mesobacillus subterraneus]
MHPVILFDGVCNFCDASVQFILERDPKETFHFASLQSEAGQELLRKYNVSDDVDSMILIENDKVYYKSSAALRISRHLKGAWKLLYALMIVPAPIRNIAYDILAKNRYKWFGQKESCMLPPPNVRKRFL